MPTTYPDIAIRPHRPDYLSITNPDGTVRDPYKMGVGSAYNGLLKDQQGLYQRQALTDATQSAQAQGNNAWSMLASQGGIDRGAAERLAMNSGENALDQQAKIRNQGMSDLVGIDAAGAKGDINNSIMDRMGNNAQNFGNYSEDMKAWAAGRTADAQEKAGKK